MTEKQVSYKSFLLRLWRDKEVEDRWRVTLFSVAGSTESFHFADLDSFFHFLEAETSAQEHIVQSDKDN